jgi:hypothetical protein
MEKSYKERQARYPQHTHIHDLSLFLFRTDTLINSGGVKLVLCSWERVAQNLIRP